MSQSLLILAKELQQLKIAHSDYVKGRRELQELWEFTELKLGMNAKSLIGPPGSGKTTLAKSFVSDHPTTRTIDGIQVPVAFVQLPSTPSVKNTLGAILKALGDQTPTKGSVEDREHRIEVLIKECGTKVIIFDEYQRLLRWGTERKIEDVFELLKDYIRPDLGVLIVGLPECVQVISDNGQIKRRLQASVTLRRYSLKIKDDFMEFAGILKGYEKLISQYIGIPNLSSKNMVEKFYCASGGLIGLVSKILVYAVIDAQKNNKTAISLADLAFARSNAVFDHELWNRYGEPFSDEFNIKSIPNYEYLAMQVSANDKSVSRPQKQRKEKLSELVAA